MKHLPRFIGGTHNGEYLSEAYKVGGRWPGVFYLPSKITIEEERRLNIDGAMKWKHPDDAYDFTGANYIFRHRVDYKPNELNMDVTLDDFHDALDKAYIDISQIDLESSEFFTELFETGSAELKVNDRKFIIAITIQEVK